MGNGVRKLNLCFAGDVGEISKRYNDLNFTDPLDEGLGHSFCYIRPDPYSKPHPFSDDSSSSSTTTTISSSTTSTTTAAFRTISGASISANTFTPLSTALVDFSSHVDKASAFESSQFFFLQSLYSHIRGVFFIPARSRPVYQTRALDWVRAL